MTPERMGAKREYSKKMLPQCRARSITKKRALREKETWVLWVMLLP